MVTAIEVGVLIAAVIGLLLAIRYRRTVRALAINAIIGLLVLAVANAIGIGVELSVWTLLVCAIAGLPGALLVIILALLDIAFVAATVPVVETVSLL